MSIKIQITSFLSMVLFISAVQPALPMDLARAENRTDMAVSAFGVSGEGVIVAIIDRGIDWRSNDFRNDDGTTRIKYIFDMIDNSGANAPGNTYGVGTIYTEAQINAALSGGPALATRDAVGHGTTTTGIAAGNGSNLPDRKYRGIAPKASIIAVKFTTEGAPAHSGQPAEAPFYNPALFPKAVDFVRDKAAELNMPAVMLANFGSIGGPTDGTSEFSRTVDSKFGAGKPGLVFVNGTGDDGGMPNHAGGTIAQGEAAAIQIQKVTTGVLRLDLWYAGSDRFAVSIQTPSATFGPYAPPNNGTFHQVQNSSFYYRHGGAGSVFYGASNGKREIFLDISGPVGTYTLTLQGQSVTDGRFDGTINPSTIFGANNNNRFLNFVVPGSIWDGATAFNNIAPNSYNIRTHWIDVDGVPRSNTSQGAIGELWLGSSIGPTFDGRLGTDISAPGDSVFTSYSPTSYFSEFRFNMIQGGGTFYGRASAVSAAAPQVTGIIALMLEKTPGLDAIQVRNMLRASGRADSFTGSLPNTVWGYGKVDAHKAVMLAAQSAGSAPFDYDGDGKTDISVFRPTDGNWYLQQSTSGYSGVNFGIGSDRIVPADYDGDGKTDVAVYRPSEGTWYIANSANGTYTAVQFGIAEDLPAPADYDGDGKADLAVFRPSQGTWYISNSANGTFTINQFGQGGDIPTIGDFDGDGKSDIAVYRPATGIWYKVNSSDGSFSGEQFGLSTDRIVPADYDGDGKTDIAVYRPFDGVWHIKYSSDSTYHSSAFGLAADIPAPGDYDGDGKSDLSVFRPSDGTWYIANSSNSSFTILQWGANGDRPTPGAYGY